MKFPRFLCILKFLRTVGDFNLDELLGCPMNPAKFNKNLTSFNVKYNF